MVIFWNILSPGVLKIIVDYFKNPPCTGACKGIANINYTIYYMISFMLSLPFP